MSWMRGRRTSEGVRRLADAAQRSVDARRVPTASDRLVWRWARRPRSVQADDGTRHIRMLVSDIARCYGKESARLAVMQAETDWIRSSNEEVERRIEELNRIAALDATRLSDELRGFFSKRAARRAEEREEREQIRRLERRRRFWRGLREVTIRAWRG